MTEHDRAHISGVFSNCFKGGGGGGKTEVPRNNGGGGGLGIQPFSVIYAILMDIRLDKLPSGGREKSKGGECPLTPPPPPKCTPVYDTFSMQFCFSKHDSDRLKYCMNLVCVVCVGVRMCGSLCLCATLIAIRQSMHTTQTAPLTQHSTNTGLYSLG